MQPWPSPTVPQGIHVRQNTPVLVTAVTERRVGEMFAFSSFCSVLFEFSAMNMYHIWRHGNKEKKRKKSKVILAMAMSTGKRRLNTFQESEESKGERVMKSVQSN